MPSGAKKRKAAKKKKEQASHHQITISTKSNHGNDDPRSQEERESDSSVSSPASHDTENDHQFKTIEEPVKQASGFGEEASTKVEKELEPGENIEITGSSPDQDKSSSSSSSSSSDDESREIEKRDDKEAGDLAAEVITNSLSEQAISSAAANAPFSGGNTSPSESTMITEPNPEEQIQIVSAVDKVVSISNVDEEESLPNVNVNENAARDVSASDKNREASSGGIDSDLKELPVSENSGVPEGIKESEILISQETETRVRPPPLGVAQRTSWLSCCGLFDVITGSRA